MTDLLLLEPTTPFKQIAEFLGAEARVGCDHIHLPDGTRVKVGEALARNQHGLFHFQPCSDECLERAECPKVGDTGHWQCGYCAVHHLPRHHCGCLWSDDE